MFDDFLQILTAYELKRVSRNCSNNYFCEKEQKDHKRKETTAEHVYSTLKLADYFLSSEDEFSGLDRLKVYELLMYHDDIEIETEEICISNREKRINKKEDELKALPNLAKRYPKQLRTKLLALDNEFRQAQTDESRFAHAIDKMDALVHELPYPEDWGPKNFTEQNVREWFGPAFTYSPTFSQYFEFIIVYLQKNGHFNTK